MNTDYNIYVVAGSDHPGYPDLPPDYEVYKIPCRTQTYVKSNDTIINVIRITS